MATSTLYQTTQLATSSNSPSSCLYGSTASPHPSVEPRADWRASFTESCGIPRKPKPLLLSYQNGEWKSNFCKLYSSTTSATSLHLLPEDCISPQAALKPNNPLSTSMFIADRNEVSVQCHVCDTPIGEPFFCNHLFFGRVKCDLCGLLCNDCSVFQRVTISMKKGMSSCQHNFSYIEDPHDYLMPRVSVSVVDQEVCSLPLPTNLRALEHYISKLKSVHLQNPWCTAVRICRTRLLKSYNTNTVKPNWNSHNHLASSPECDQRDNHSEKRPKTNPSQNTNQLEFKDKESDGELLLTQNYDLEHLEKEVEYVGVNEELRVPEKQNQLSASNKPKKRHKRNPYKNLKGQRFTNLNKRRQSSISLSSEESELEFVVEDLALPEDGNYLMVREALEECPMCYESLNIKDCVVNMRTFLFTVTCSECALLIFIVPDLPDGLQIIMDKNVKAKETPNLSEEVKSLGSKQRRIQARDFFAK